MRVGFSQSQNPNGRAGRAASRYPSSPSPIAAILIALAVADPEQCREALTEYNQIVAAIHAAARDYERCLAASKGRDDCGAQVVELQVTHRDFAAAVTERITKCRAQNE